MAVAVDKVRWGTAADDPSAPSSVGPSAVSSAEPTDEALARAAPHDPAAFAALYRRHVDAVYRYAHRRLGTRERAEDATAATFERALAGIATYRRGPFRAWLFAIARNATVDAYRRATPTLPLPDAYDAPDPAPGPEEELAARDGAAWVRSLLAYLDGDARDVVELRLAGLTDREIARVLGKRPGAVRTAQHRALKRLRDLAEQDPTYDAWR